jgi:hypothetical protein
MSVLAGILTFVFLFELTLEHLNFLSLSVSLQVRKTQRGA